MNLSVEWTATDPAGLAARLAERLEPQAPVDPTRTVLELAGGTLRFVLAPPGGIDRLRLVDGARPPEGQVTDRTRPRLLAVGWATVEASRAAAEVAESLGTNASAFVPAAGDDWLGARAWVAPAGTAAVVLLEPSTEGRLAAALARSGEGPCAVYLSAAAVGSDALRTGPFGPAGLFAAGRASGPFALLVAPRALGTSESRRTIRA